MLITFRGVWNFPRLGNSVFRYYQHLETSIWRLANCIGQSFLQQNDDFTNTIPRKFNRYLYATADMFAVATADVSAARDMFAVAAADLSAAAVADLPKTYPNPFKNLSKPDQKPIKTLSKTNQNPIKKRSKPYQKLIKNRSKPIQTLSKTDQKPVKNLFKPDQKLIKPDQNPIKNRSETHQKHIKNLWVRGVCWTEFSWNSVSKSSFLAQITMGRVPYRDRIGPSWDPTGPLLIFS